MLVTVVDEAFDDETVDTLALSSSVDSRLSRAEPNDELLINSVPLSTLKKSSESKASVIFITLLASVTVDDMSLASSCIVSAILDFVVSITDDVPKYLRMMMAALSSGMPEVSSTGFSFLTGCLFPTRGEDGADEKGFCIDWMVERKRPQLLTLLTLDTDLNDSVLVFLPHSAKLFVLSARELSNV